MQKEWQKSKAHWNTDSMKTVPSPFISQNTITSWYTNIKKMT